MITPSSATIAAGGSQQFSAQGYDANNVAIPGLTYSWAVVAGGGTINATGLFTAGNVTGTYTDTVQVVAVQGSIVKLAFASVKVTAVPATWMPPGLRKHGFLARFGDKFLPPGWFHGKKTGWYKD